MKLDVSLEVDGKAAMLWLLNYLNRSLKSFLNLRFDVTALEGGDGRIVYG